MAIGKFGARVHVLAIVGALALAAGMLVLLAPAAVGAAPSCAVSNARTHKGYSSLQTAVDAVKAGDTLEVKGTCVGNTSVGKTVTLKGVTNKTFPGTPTLDGGGAGTVLHITNGTTTIDGLTITHGVASAESVEGNPCCVGGGIAVSGAAAGAHVVNSLVTGNASGVFGGGIDVDDGTLTLENSTVSGNTASSSGGIDSDFGTITLIDSAVSGNVATGGGDLHERRPFLCRRHLELRRNTHPDRFDRQRKQRRRPRRRDRQPAVWSAPHPERDEHDQLQHCGGIRGRNLDP